MTPENRPNFANSFFKRFGENTEKTFDKMGNAPVNAINQLDKVIAGRSQPEKRRILNFIDKIGDKMIDTIDNLPGLKTKKEPQISSELNKPKLDALIVLGHNIGAGWKGERIRQNPDNLSGHSKLSTLAAAIAFKERLTDKIIFSSGHTSGIETRSEAEAMRDFLKIRFPEIPDGAIILESNSIDTAGNAEESKKIVDQNQFKNIGLMSTRDHLNNSIILFKRYGLRVKKENCFASEELVAKYMEKINTPEKPKDPKSFLEGYRKSPQVKGDRKKELIRSILLRTIDPKGKILRQVSKRTRK
jgi:uncharacterized SAM-binding protein YcdF (DUF218 family)